MIEVNLIIIIESLKLALCLIILKKIKKSTFLAKSAFNNGGVGGVRTLVQTTIYQAFYMLSF